MSNSGELDTTPDAVGYGKPPKDGQFKKGKSGNAKGRPKGSGMRSSVEKVLDRKVTVTVDGERRKVPLTEALVMQLAQRALGGDAVASRDFLKIADQMSKAVAVEEAKPRGLQVVLMQFGEPTGCDGALHVLDIVAIVKGQYKIQPWVVAAAMARHPTLSASDDELVATFSVNNGDEFTLRRSD